MPASNEPALLARNTHCAADKMLDIVSISSHPACFPACVCTVTQQLEGAPMAAEGVSPN